MPNGTVRNHTSKTLWVVETDSGPAIAHKLGPNRSSPDSVDADGVRAVDGTPIGGHRSWWKLRDFNTADITASNGQLSIDCFLCSRVEDDEFGNVTYDNSDGWGVEFEK